MIYYIYIYTHYIYTIIYIYIYIYILYIYISLSPGFRLTVSVDTRFFTVALSQRRAIRAKSDGDVVWRPAFLVIVDIKRRWQPRYRVWSHRELRISSEELHGLWWKGWKKVTTGLLQPIVGNDSHQAGKWVMSPLYLANSPCTLGAGSNPEMWNAC